MKHFIEQTQRKQTQRYMLKDQWQRIMVGTVWVNSCKKNSTAMRFIIESKFLYQNICEDNKENIRKHIEQLRIRNQSNIALLPKKSRNQENYQIN